jgi:DNA repair exonuclease SbcCD ATPase subunit
MKILKENKTEIEFLIDRNKDIWKEIKRIDNYAEKLKHFSLDWKDDNTMIAKKIKLEKCPFCGRKEELIFEYDNGEKVYNICCFCWIKMNS